ncbi:TPA: hypothetical protein EYO57_14930 [Candidatus Poribacteria bacterium]|nr:hypothetical protein [Candidatus Poribacteria bacterium]
MSHRRRRSKLTLGNGRRTEGPPRADLRTPMSRLYLWTLASCRSNLVVGITQVWCPLKGCQQITGGHTCHSGAQGIHTGFAIYGHVLDDFPAHSVHIPMW